MLILTLVNSFYKGLNDVILLWSNRICFYNVLGILTKQSALLITIFLLSIMAIRKDISISSFLMLIAASQQIAMSLDMMFINIPNFVSHSYKIGKFREFINVNTTSNNCYGSEIIRKIDNITLKNIFFKYDKNNEILKNINFSININDNKIAIIGKNGMGKSTLMMIIAGLLIPDEGNVYLNGVNLKSISNETRVKNIDFVFQDFKLFSTSIKNNILINSNFKTEDEVEENLFRALDLVGLKEKILNLPEGVETILFNEFDDNGVNFSQGELQRLMLAKIYCSDSKVVFLDEPFSFVDSFFKGKAELVLDEISKRKKIIIVTHDDNMFNLFDKIIKIEDGKAIIIK